MPRLENEPEIASAIKAIGSDFWLKFSREVVKYRGYAAGLQQAKEDAQLALTLHERGAKLR
jgi:hypothetical protein